MQSPWVATQPTLASKPIACCLQARQAYFLTSLCQAHSVQGTLGCLTADRAFAHLPDRPKWDRKKSPNSKSNTLACDIWSTQCSATIWTHNRIQFRIDLCLRDERYFNWLIESVPGLSSKCRRNLKPNPSNGVGIQPVHADGTLISNKRWDVHGLQPRSGKVRLMRK